MTAEFRGERMKTGLQLQGADVTPEALGGHMRNGLPGEHT